MASISIPPDLKYDDITTIEARGEKFCIHTYFLSNSSPFFKAKLKPEWNHGNGITVDIHPRDFRVYVNWLYSGNIDAADIRQSSGDTSTPLGRFIDLWIMGMFILDLKFCNALLHRMWLNARTYYDASMPWAYNHPADMAKIWQHTEPESPLRKFVLSIWINKGQDQPVLESEQVDALAYGEFKSDFIRALRPDKHNDNWRRGQKASSRQYVWAHDEHIGLKQYQFDDEAIRKAEGQADEKADEDKQKDDTSGSRAAKRSRTS